MRMAILSDIHGNLVALDAVLYDIEQRGGVDMIWALGDFAALGPDPVAALERVASLPNLHTVRGNTDRYLTTGQLPGPTADAVRADPSLLEAHVSVARSFAWTQGAVTAAGWFAWLAALPLEQRLTLADGTRLLGVHAAPGQDDGAGIRPVHSPEHLRAALAGCQADLVFVGHTHWPLDATVDGVRIVNLGSVSNPYPPDLRAKYVLLESDQTGYRLEGRQVDYDRQAVVAAVQKVKHPGAEFITRYMQGQNRPPWA